MELIDKSAVVVEIERRMKGLKNCHADTVADYAGEISGLERLLSFLDTLEVKEVDMDFMLHEYWNLSSKITIDCLENATMTKDEMIDFAKHFFELELKANKGE